MTQLNPIPKPLTVAPRAFLFHCAPKAEAAGGEAPNWQLSLREMDGALREQSFSTMDAFIEFISLELGMHLTANNQTTLSAVGVGSPETFVPLVEDALRHLHNLLDLGENPLTALALVERYVHAPGGASASFLERAKALHRVLINTLELLAPDGAEPSRQCIPPREWHSYLILRNAYVRCEPNRNMMCWLQIGEGTFNRSRRRALQTLAKALFELEDAARKSKSEL